MTNADVYDTILTQLKTLPKGAVLPLLVDGEPHLVHISRRPQDGKGVFRFVGNPIVRDLLDFASHGKLDPTGLEPSLRPRCYSLNEIARAGDRGYTKRDRVRLYIDIAYSVDGFLSLAAQGLFGEIDEENEDDEGVVLSLPGGSR